MHRTALAFLCSLCLSAAAWAQAPEVPVRVVTLNLWHKKRDLKARTAAAARVLKALRPDLIGLQEVSGSWWRKNRAKKIASELGYAWSYGQSDGLKAVFAEGLAVLTPRPHTAGRKKLPHSLIPPFERRFVQWAETTAADGQVVLLFNTHLTHHDGHGWQVERLEQALEVLDVMATRALARDVPAVLVGDLNSLPTHLALRALTGSLLGGAPPLLDAGKAAGDTVGPKNCYTPQESAARIDYVLVLRGTRRALVPKAARRIGVEPALSDHYGVVVDLALQPAPLLAASAHRGARGALAGQAARSPRRVRSPAQAASGLRKRIGALQARIDAIREQARKTLTGGDPAEVVSSKELRGEVLKRVLAAFPAPQKPPGRGR